MAKFCSRFFLPAISFKHWLKIGLSLVLVIFLIGLAVSWYLIVPVSSNSKLVKVNIVAGQGVKQISSSLKKAELIRSSNWFEFWVWLTGKEKSLVAGEYYLPQNINLINLVNMIAGGVTPSSEVTIRFPEGWTLVQMGEYLEKNGIVSSKDFTRSATSPNIFSKFLPEALKKDLFNGSIPASLEGYLFPDTYRVYRDVTSFDLIRKLLSNFDKKFKPDWLTELNQRSISLKQAVILASIVEREVTGSTDRKIVADIFWRRLQAGRGLEADSTINYITGKNTPAVSGKDLSVDSPYNTYRYRGLPPGPISNPGESALEAVVYPQPNAYWYFLTTPEGKVIYSKTFDEHKIAKQKFLK